MRSKIDIAAECLHEVLPILSQFASVVGAAQSSAPGVVTFLIEGDMVPDLPKVTCSITKGVGEKVGQMTARFEAAPS